MKAGFSLVKKFVPKWNGNRDASEPLTVTMKMPEVGDVFSMLDVLKTQQVTTDADASSVGIERSRIIAKECGVYLPRYIELDNAEDFKIEDVVKYPPYFPLAIELLFELLAYAQPNEAEVKNS